MSLALEFEAKSRPLRDPKGSSISTYKSNPSQTSSRDQRNLPAAGQNTSSSFQSRNWEPEKQQRRDKGLCFRCNEKFAPGHRCKASTFSLLEVSNESEQQAEEETDVEEIEQVENKSMLAEISFHAILGKKKVQP